MSDEPAYATAESAGRSRVSRVALPRGNGVVPEGLLTIYPLPQFPHKECLTTLSWWDSMS